MSLSWRSTIGAPFRADRLYRFRVKATGPGAIAAPIAALAQLGSHGRVIMQAGGQPGTDAARRVGGVLSPVSVWLVIWLPSASVAERRDSFAVLQRTVAARVTSAAIVLEGLEEATITADARARLWAVTVPGSLSYPRLQELAGPSVAERAAETVDRAAQAATSAAAAAGNAVSSTVDAVQNAGAGIANAAENGITYTKILLGLVAVGAAYVLAREARRG